MCLQGIMYLSLPILGGGGQILSFHIVLQVRKLDYLLFGFLISLFSIRHKHNHEIEY